MIDGSQVADGDVVLGLASTGFHSNGYSLLRKVLDVSGLALGDAFPDFEETIAEILLEPTRIYVRSVVDLLGRRRHHTGDGARHRWRNGRQPLAE